MQKNKSHLNSIKPINQIDELQVPGPLEVRKSSKQAYVYKFLGSPSTVRVKCQQDPFFRAKLKAAVQASCYILNQIFDIDDQDQKINQRINSQNSFTISDFRKRRYKKQKSKNFTYSIFLKTINEKN